MRRPIERPLIRKQLWDGTNVPGWKVVCNFEDGSSETTWQRFEDAMKWAVGQCGPREPSERVHDLGATQHWDPLIRADRLRQEAAALRRYVR